LIQSRANLSDGREVSFPFSSIEFMSVNNVSAQRGHLEKETRFGKGGALTFWAEAGRRKNTPKTFGREEDFLESDGAGVK